MEATSAVVEPDRPLDGLLKTWNEIIADVKSGKIKTDDSRYECSFCFNSGFREIADPTGSPYRGVVRCSQCRYWEFRRQDGKY